jgi:hypothetical protein
VDLIKLDASLISQNDGNNNDDGDDTHLLSSKLNTNMKGEQILNACKSYGLNGLQSNCILQQITSSNTTLGKKRKLSKKFKYKSNLIDGVTEEEIEGGGGGGGRGEVKEKREKLKKKVNVLAKK